MGKQCESLVPWLQLLPRERSAEKFKGAEKPKQAERSSQAKVGFNIEKGVGNCKRKRKKRREVAGNKESSWRRAAVLGPSPPAFSTAGVQGWGGECGALAPWDTKAWSGRGTASPLLHPWTPCHPLAPALWTGVVPVQTTLGKSRRSDPSGNRRASGMLLRSLWSSRRERQKQQVIAAGRSWVMGLQAAKDRHSK